MDRHDSSCTRGRETNPLVLLVFEDLLATAHVIASIHVHRRPEPGIVFGEEGDVARRLSVVDGRGWLTDNGEVQTSLGAMSCHEFARYASQFTPLCDGLWIEPIRTSLQCGIFY